MISLNLSKYAHEFCTLSDTNKPIRFLHQFKYSSSVWGPTKLPNKSILTNFSQEKEKQEL